MFDQYICYDEFSGRYFVSNLATIQQATALSLAQFLEQGWSSLNDFYDFLELPPIPLGYDLGWHAARDERPDIRLAAILTPANTPALSFGFRKMPKLAPSSHAEGGRHV